MAKETRQRVRKRTTPRKAWRQRFLLALSQMPNVRAACETAGISRKTVYQERAKDEAFAAEWDTAIEEACDRLEEEAHRRAVKGTVKPLVSRGQVVFARFDAEGNIVASGEEGEERPVMMHEFSDQLLTTLLKAHRPEKFRERHDVTVTKQGSEVDQEILNLTREMNQRDPARTS